MLSDSFFYDEGEYSYFDADPESRFIGQEIVVLSSNSQHSLVRLLEYPNIQYTIETDYIDINY